MTLLLETQGEEKIQIVNTPMGHIILMIILTINKDNAN